MITAQPEPFAVITTARLLPGWHRFAALLARRDLARTLRKIGDQAASQGRFTARRLDIAVIWYSHDGTDRGHLAATVRTVRAALSAAGIDLTHASVTARTRTTTAALRPASPALSFPALEEALTPRVVVDIAEDA